MAAVAVQQAQETPYYPAISQEVRDQISADRRRLLSTPEVATPPADLGFGGKYRFRSKPGTRKTILHTIPLKPEAATFKSDEHHAFALRTWGRIVAQSAFPDMERHAAIEAFAQKMYDLQDRLGDNMIRFARVPRHIECVFSTDDEKVAEYLRGLIASGQEPWDDVYEESGTSRVVVGAGDKAKAYPNTTAGWNAARAYAASSKQEDIKIVNE